MTEVSNEWQCYDCDSPEEVFRGLNSKFHVLVGMMLGASAAPRYTL